MEEEEIGAILFMDIVGSSKLWKEKGKKFYRSLKQFEEFILEKTRLFRGLVIKMIGDAFMIYFENLFNCLLFAISIQCKILRLDNKSPIKIRIGICYGGDMWKKTLNIQNCEQIDFFGQTVNIASRMESKVATVNGIGLSFNKEYDERTELMFIDILNNVSQELKCNLKVKIIDFIDEEEKRPVRQPSGINLDHFNPVTKKSTELKGVGALRAYLITLEEKYLI